MKLEGSCHCGEVRFSLEAQSPYPFLRCYCSICRKTAGGGGYAVNLGGDAKTLRVSGRKAVKVYRVKAERTGSGGKGLSSARRHFCSLCGSALWLFDPTWPDLVHPFASAIDTPLPVPPEYSHMMLDFKANWVEVPGGKRHTQKFPVYPDESLAGWHARHGLLPGAKKKK
jgi:hypothetical protein